MSEPTMIGIDLGTYNSAACVLIGGQPVLLRPEGRILGAT